MSLLSVTGPFAGQDPRIGLLAPNLTFELPAGTLTGVFGPNGCGKTTLLKIAAGVLPDARASRLAVSGTSLLESSRAEHARAVFYCGSELWSEFPLTLADWFEAGSGLSTSEVEPWARKLRLEQHLSRSIATLSDGERQRAILARALARAPRVLILDETLSKVDLNFQIEIGAVLKAWAGADRSVVLVGHDLPLLSHVCDRLVLMRGGQIVMQGKPDEVRAASVFREIYPLG